MRGFYSADCGLVFAATSKFEDASAQQTVLFNATTRVPLGEQQWAPSADGCACACTETDCPYSHKHTQQRVTLSTEPQTCRRPGRCS